MTTRRALVTGASSGIGAATVRTLTNQGWSVLAVARRADRLAALADETGCDTAVVDVTNDADIAAMVDQAAGCDAVVNNAGGALGVDHIADGAVAEWQQMYDVNVLGVLRVTQAMLPILRQAPSADVLTVTSTAGLASYEGGGGYCAAKHAARALMDTLRLELCGEPIRVTQLAPGMVETAEFSVNRHRGDAEAAAAVYAGVDQPLTAEDVADSVAWMLSRPAHVNIDSMVIRPVAQAANHKVSRSASS